MEQQYKYTVSCGIQTVVVVATDERSAERAAEGLSGCWPCKVLRSEPYRPAEATEPRL